jgi:two-component system response regulator CpxR
MLAVYCAPYGLRLSAQHHARDGMEAARQGGFDLIVLDVMLPGMDGFSALRAMRQWSDVRVLLLTARGDDTDRLTGFESGADDYLAKPFNPRELVARVRAILRRGKDGGGSSADRGSPVRRISVGNVSMDAGARVVHVEDQRLELTAVEFELLSAFLQSAGQVLSREELVSRVLERPFHPEDRSLDMCVSRLRRKLDSATRQKGRIKTIRSAGYMFSVEN